MFKQYIRGTLHFPKREVVYWDFTPILTDPIVREKAIEAICRHFEGKDLTHVAAIEAKGFILGSLIAHQLRLPLHLIRKPGLTPGSVVSQGFEKEYGTAVYEMAKGSIPSDSRTLLVYDIFAGPGATLASKKLIEDSDAKVVGCAFVVELMYHPGREKLEGLDLFSLVQIDEEDRDAVQSH